MASLVFPILLALLSLHLVTLNVSTALTKAMDTNHIAKPSDVRHLVSRVFYLDLNEELLTVASLNSLIDLTTTILDGGNMDAPCANRMIQAMSRIMGAPMENNGLEYFNIDWGLKGTYANILQRLTQRMINPNDVIRIYHPYLG